MAIDASMEPMLEVFIFETTTLLEQLDEIVLGAEKTRSFENSGINEIFRIMHTIKGSAAMMDFTSIAALAHAVEDVFFIIREHPDALGSVSENLFDLVFLASDYLKEEMEAVQAFHETRGNPQNLIDQLSRLASLLKGEEVPPDAVGTDLPASVPAPAPEATPVVAAPAGQRYRLRVRYEEGCQMENIRAFMLITQLEDLCDELISIPDRPESDASLSADIIRDGLILIFTPAAGVSLDEIYAVIEAAVNIESYELLDTEAPLDDFEAVHISTADGPTEDDIPREEVTPAQAARAMLPGSGRQQSLISVHQYKLDQLMDLMGELVTTESMVINNVDLRDMRLDNFSKSARELRKLTDELQDVVMSIRMVPLSGVFQRMQRIARDVSKKLDKQVELITLGGETEVDKTINDAIGDPFMHMVRNSVDHGIEDPQTRRRLGKPEVGRIVMEAKNVGGEIVITISDDGKGLDADKILDKARRNGLLTKPESEYSKTEIYNLIMLPGFSTNQAVTEFSGRGVGMDVVRQNIEKVGGSINIDSTPNEGSTFTIKIPLTLAIVDGMELAVGDTIFTLPITSIQQSFKVNDPKQILYNTDGSEMILLRGKCFPIIRLHRIFNFETEITDITEGILILVEGAREEACIFVDELLGEQQVVVKPFPPFLSKYAVKRMGLSGCTILGDGTISLILDANNLLAQHH